MLVQHLARHIFVDVIDDSLAQELQDKARWNEFRIVKMANVVSTALSQDTQGADEHSFNPVAEKGDGGAMDTVDLDGTLSLGDECHVVACRRERAGLLQEDTDVVPRVNRR
jgi:TATA-binding protein-associated factor Taf7